MRPAALDLKRTAIENMLASSAEVYVRINAPLAGCVVPTVLQGDPALVLRLGWNLTPPIADLTLDDVGISGTLSFRGVPFHCRLPWAAVYAAHPAGEPQAGLYWVDSVPAEMKHATPVEPKLTPAEEKARKRAHLKLVN